MQFYDDPFQMYIAVPKNKDGIAECITGVYTENVKLFDISKEEYLTLFYEGIIDQINTIDDVIIGSYESDHIPFNRCYDCLCVIRQSKQFANGEFSKALQAGLLYGFGVYTEF